MYGAFLRLHSRFHPLASCCPSFTLSAWTAVGMSTFHDLMMVYRSGSILGYPDTFRYKHVMSYKVRK